MRLLNICKMAVRWTDLDAYGHLNHAVFFDFMTEARTDLLADLINVEGMCQFVTAHVECDYKFPYYHPDTIVLKQYCESISNSSFKLKYEFYAESKLDVLHAHAAAVMVAFNPVSRRSTRIPQEVVKLLESGIPFEKK